MDIREQLCEFGLSLYKRGLSHGSTGNLSVRLPDGNLLVTPTGSSLGRLQPEQLSVIKPGGELISGDRPTKEVPLHQALYSTRGDKAGAVVHLHSCYATALSLLPTDNEHDWLPHLTPYGIMQLGQVRLLPYFIPGDPEIGSAIRGPCRQACSHHARESWPRCISKNTGGRCICLRGARGCIEACLLNPRS